MNRESLELIQKLIEITADIGELKGELKTVREENEYLRKLLKERIENHEIA